MSHGHRHGYYVLHGPEPYATNPAGAVPPCNLEAGRVLLLTLPVGILCIPLALAGGPAGRIQRGLARRLLGVEVEEPERTGPLALAHAVISLPLNVIAATVTVYFWTLVPLNLGWPLRPDADPAKDWGGPTLAAPGRCMRSAAE